MAKAMYCMDTKYIYDLNKDLKNILSWCHLKLCNFYIKWMLHYLIIAYNQHFLPLKFIFKHFQLWTVEGSAQ